MKTRKLLAILLALAMAVGLLAVATIPASAAKCTRCTGTGWYECWECCGMGYYYRCPDHPGITGFSPMSCDGCGTAMVFYNPCDGGCTDDGDGFYVAACSKCGGTGNDGVTPARPCKDCDGVGNKLCFVCTGTGTAPGGAPCTIGTLYGDGYWRTSCNSCDGTGIDPCVWVPCTGPGDHSHAYFADPVVPPHHKCLTDEGHYGPCEDTAGDGFSDDCGQDIAPPTVCDVCGENPCECGDKPTPNNFKLWGKPTNYSKDKWYNWVLLIVCFGWIWMVF